MTIFPIGEFALYLAIRSVKALSGRRKQPESSTMATTIRIDDTIRPTRSNENGSSSGVNNGIYYMRSVSRTSLDKRSSRGRKGSIDHRSLHDPAEDEDSGLRQTGDYKQRQVSLLI